jgi:hypothetical protein
MVGLWIEGAIPFQPTISRGYIIKPVAFKAVSLWVEMNFYGLITFDSGRNGLRWGCTLNSQNLIIAFTNPYLPKKNISQGRV